MEIFKTIADQDQAIGALLIERGQIDQGKLQDILEFAEKNDTKFGESAIQMGFLSEEDFLEVLSEQIMTPYVDQILTSLLSVLRANQIFEDIAANTAATLGRLGMICSQHLAPLLEFYLYDWLESRNRR